MAELAADAAAAAPAAKEAWSADAAAAAETAVDAAGAGAAEAPTFDESLLSLEGVPPEKRDKLVARLKERLTVLDACAAVELTEAEKKDLKSKKKKQGARKKKQGEAEASSKDDDGKDDAAQSAAEALAEKHRLDFEKLTKRLEDEKRTFEEEMANLKVKQEEENERANSDCDARVAALREENDRLRKLYGGPAS